MDNFSSRKAGTGSTQIMSRKEDPWGKSASRVAPTTVLERPSSKAEHVQDHHKVKRTSHDHVTKNSSSSTTLKDPQRISSNSSRPDHVKLTKDGTSKAIKIPPHRNHHGTSVESVVRPGPRHVKLDADTREREIVRSKLTGPGGDSKMVLQRVGAGDHNRDHRDRSLKRSHHQEDFKVVQQRPKLGEGRDRDQSRDRVADELKGRPFIKPKSATRPDAIKSRGDERAPSHSRDNIERMRPSLNATTNSSARVTEEVGGVVKKAMKLSSEYVRNGAAVKAEGGGKDVRVQRSIAKIEQARAGVARSEPVRSVKMVTGTVVKAKQEKLKKKVFSLPGQRFEPPEERDALRLFYASLHRQIPTSDMANIWLMEHGLLEADEAQRVLTHKVKSKTGVVSKGAHNTFQTPTPSKFRNGINGSSVSAAGKSAKFNNEDFLDIKPVSKKLKL